MRYPYKYQTWLVPHRISGPVPCLVHLDRSFHLLMNRQNCFAPAIAGLRATGGSGSSHSISRVLTETCAGSVRLLCIALGALVANAGGTV